jgi:hypothetical protein
VNRDVDDGLPPGRTEDIRDESGTRSVELAFGETVAEGVRVTRGVPGR